MTDLYLIAHLVRKQPAFDIAEKVPCTHCQGGENVHGDWVEAEVEQDSCFMCDGDGFWWQVPTSGHRAHPYWFHELAIMTWPSIIEGGVAALPPLEPPPNHPDHYPINDTDYKQPRLSLATLGFATEPKPTITTRRL